MIGRIRAVHADTRGASLTELLVGTVIGAMIMGVVATTIFTTNDLRQHADDRSQFAGDLSIASLSFDRDGVMATAGAPARSQAGNPTCATVIDLGFNEGGASVQYRTASGKLERVSGAGTRTMVRNVESCTWQSIQIGGPTGRYTIQVDLKLTGASGETLTQTLRVAPRMW
jgi:Tfp pilus assembly protein PilW